MFEIATLKLNNGARIGLCPLPGVYGALMSDLDDVVVWGPDMVVSMTQQSEMDAALVGDLGARFRAAGMTWRHLPTRDFGVPDDMSAAPWPQALGELHRCLDEKGAVLLHCRGGLGRSGMIALRLLVERGEVPDAALERLRAVRPGAVETQEQLAWASAGAPALKR